MECRTCRWRAWLAASCIVLVLIPSTAVGQGRLVGHVVGARGTGVDGAVVEVAPDSLSWAAGTRTSNGGRFYLSLPSGPMYIRITAARYRVLVVRVDITRDEDASVSIALTPATSMLLAATAQPSVRSMPASRFFNYYEPNYFTTGIGAPTDSSSEYRNQVKFVVAVRYRLLSGHGGYDTGLYGFFKQKSFWHLYNPSAPFWDSNYNPGLLFYYDGRDGGKPRRWLHWPSQLSAGLVVEHESNGKDGPASRSWNRLGGRLDIGDEEEHLFVVRAMAWHVISLDEEHNADLRRYAGSGELAVEWRPRRDERGRRNLGELGLSARSRVGGTRAFGNLELNGFWKPRSLPLNSSLMAQWFTGRAENLLGYQDRRSVLRLGLATVR